MNDELLIAALLDDDACYTVAEARALVGADDEPLDESPENCAALDAAR